MSYADIFVTRGGARILTIGGAWNEEIQHSIETVDFDALEIHPGIEGGFAALRPFAEKIRWLWWPKEKNPHGLQDLQFIEQINAFDWIPEPLFDYRALEKLKAFSSDAACRFPLKFLNSKKLEWLDLEEIEEKDLSFLNEAKNLQALRLVAGPLKSLAGIEVLSNLRELRLLHFRSLADISELRHVPQLEILELDKTPKVLDTSAITELVNLRWISIDGRKSKQSNLDWITKMPNLECAAIWVETESIDWSVFAQHPRLYEMGFYVSREVVLESDEEIVVKLSAFGKKVKSFKRYPKGPFPGFIIHFESPADIKMPLSIGLLLNHLYTKPVFKK